MNFYHSFNNLIKLNIDTELISQAVLGTSASIAIILFDDSPVDPWNKIINLKKKV